MQPTNKNQHSTLMHKHWASQYFFRNAPLMTTTDFNGCTVNYFFADFAINPYVWLWIMSLVVEKTNTNKRASLFFRKKNHLNESGMHSFVSISEPLFCFMMPCVCYFIKLNITTVQCVCTQNNVFNNDDDDDAIASKSARKKWKSGNYHDNIQCSDYKKYDVLCCVDLMNNKATIATDR